MIKIVKKILFENVKNLSSFFYFSLFLFFHSFVLFCFVLFFFFEMPRATPKYTNEEKGMVVLCELLGSLQELKKQDQLQVRNKRNPKDEASIEKAKKLLESAQMKEGTGDPTSSGERKRPSASLRKPQEGPVQKKPRSSSAVTGPPPLPLSTVTPSTGLGIPPAGGGDFRRSDNHLESRERNQGGGGGGNCQIFVGDLNQMHPPEEHRRQMEATFSKYGEILSIRILWGKNCGFIIFRTQQQAENAIYGMNRQMLGGVPVRVSWGKERSPFDRDERRGGGGRRF